MKPGSRKDAPQAAPEPGPSDPLDNDLLTSEDLFGDLVDAPARPSTAAATRRGPIKVQVFDAASDNVRPQPPLTPEAADMLLGALGGEEPPASAEVDLADTLLAPDPPAPPPVVTPPSAARPAGGEVDTLLDALVPEDASPAAAAAPGPRPIEGAGGPPAAPARAADASPLTGHAQEFESLLDNLGPDPSSAPVPAPSPPASRPRAVPAPPPAAAPPAPPRRRAADPLDALLLEGEGAKAGPASPAAAAAPAEAAARATTKFRAATAKPAVEDGALLDLKLVAESALGTGGSRTAPVASAEAPPPPRPARRRDVERESYGPYQLLERIAVGGMAEVFRAKRQGVEGFEKVVAVKRILPHLSDNKEFVDMFVHEAKMVAGLTHPNIVQIFDLGKLESSYYIAMELVHGRDLRSIQKRAQDRGVRIPLDLGALIVSKVCSALEYAHRKKDDRGRPLQIVHRDVSPQNVLISFEGDVKLTDFGIAKAASKATTTDHGALRGKLLYMSPEQAWGHPIDRRADIFSLGVVFYELVTGHKPFLASNEGSILDAVRECRVAPPTTINPRIPEKLASVVMKALDRDPEQRYQDAAEMYRDLDRVLHERQVPAAPELSRLMNVLYDERERGDVVAVEETTPSGEDMHVEFDAPEGKRAASSGQDPSIEKLLKRFGIQ